MANKTDQCIKGLILFFNHRIVLDYLNDADRGRLVTDLLDYAEHGVLPVDYGSEVMRLAFSLLQQDVDRNTERYAEICAARSAAGKKSAAVRAAKNFPDEVSYEDELC